MWVGAVTYAVIVTAFALLFLWVSSIHPNWVIWGFITAIFAYRAGYQAR